MSRHGFQVIWSSGMFCIFTVHLLRNWPPLIGLDDERNNGWREVVGLDSPNHPHTGGQTLHCIDRPIKHDGGPSCIPILTTACAANADRVRCLASWPAYSVPVPHSGRYKQVSLRCAGRLRRGNTSTLALCSLRDSGDRWRFPLSCRPATRRP